MKKKLFCLLLSLCLLLALLPTAAAAESGSLEGGLQWSLVNGTLTISGEGPFAEFLTPPPWEARKDQIRSVVIGDGVTEIGPSTLQGLKNLNTVTVGSGVTVIGGAAFFACEKLEHVRLPAALTEIEASAFYGCTALKAVYITDVAAWCKIHFGFFSNPLNNGAALYLNGSPLEKLVIPEGVTAIAEDAFSGCSSLREVTIASSVISVGPYSFSHCNNLEKVTIGSGVTSLNGNAFYSTPALKEIRVSEANPSYCSDAAGLLYTKDMATLIRCPAQYAGSYTAPDGLKVIGQLAFDRCSNLTDVTLPDSVTTLESDSFRLSSLREIRLGSGVSAIDDTAFDLCGQLSAIRVSGANPNYCSDAAGLLFNKDMSHLYLCPAAIKGDYAIPETVRSLSNAAFYGCKELRSVTVPGGVEEIPYRCFAACESLVCVSLSLGLKSIGNDAFRDCQLLDHLFFTGSRAQWDQVEKSFRLSSMHFNTTGTELRCVETGGPSYLCCDICDRVLNRIFADVGPELYYYEPVQWAVQKEITNGTNATDFSPEAPCTRGQIVTFLWRAFGSPEPGIRENPFTDLHESLYYYKAVLWAVEQGITTGTSETTFSPEAPCTRGQVATFLWRACDSPKAEAGSQFTDVSSQLYYYEPICWAVEQGITNGTGDGLFSPESGCTRGQIVTFLYRTLAE